jgi:hypothetical protein
MYGLPAETPLVDYINLRNDSCVAAFITTSIYNTHKSNNASYKPIPFRLLPKYEGIVESVRQTLGLEEDEMIVAIQFRKPHDIGTGHGCMYSETHRLCNASTADFIDAAKSSLKAYGLEGRRTYVASHEYTDDDLHQLKNASFLTQADLLPALMDQNYSPLDWFLVDVALMCDRRTLPMAFGISSLQWYVRKCQNKDVIQIADL